MQTIHQATCNLSRLHANWISRRLELDVQSVSDLPIQDWIDAAVWSRSLVATRKALKDIVSEDNYSEFCEVTSKEYLQDIGVTMIKQKYMKMLLQAMNENSIDVMPYKGRYLEYFLGLPFSSRIEGDIDLYIKLKDIDSAIDVIRGLGGTCDRKVGDMTTHHVHAFLNPIGLIELHHSLYEDMSLSEDVDMLWSRSSQDKFLNADIQSMNTNDVYALLCNHYILHGWTMSYKWTLDLLHYQIALSCDECNDNASPFINGLSLERIKDTSSSFFILATQAIITDLTGVSIPKECTTALRNSLSEPERITIQKLESDRASEFSPDWIVMQARRSNHNSLGVMYTLWGNTYRVSMETGVKSDSPFFLFARFRWTLGRIIRGIRAKLGMRASNRSHPEQEITRYHKK